MLNYPTVIVGINQSRHVAMCRISHEGSGMCKEFLTKSILIATITTLSACVVTEEEKQQIQNAAVDLEQLASQIIITRPAKDSVVEDSQTLVLADVPSNADVKTMSLYVDGRKVSEDTDGAPWEFLWDSYYWADDNNHSLFLKAYTAEGVEVRNNDPYQVNVSVRANDALSFDDGIEGMLIQDKNELEVGFSAIPNATNYTLRLAGNNAVTREFSVDEISTTLADLGVGEYEVRYQASWKISESETVTGPWSQSVSFEVKPPELPLINVPVITPDNGKYSVTFSWSDQGEGNAYDVSVYQESDLIESVTVDSNSASMVLDAGEYHWQLRRINALSQVSESSFLDSIELGVFQKRYGNSGNEYGHKIIAAHNGGFVVLTRGDNGGRVLKLDDRGDIVWEFLAEKRVLNSVVELADGSLIFSGNAYSSDGIVLLKLDADGGGVWEKDKAQVTTNYDQLLYTGLAVIENAVYVAAQGRDCITENHSTRCHVVDSRLDKIDVATGSGTESYVLAPMDGKKYGGLSSLAATKDGNLLLSFSVKVEGCSSYYECEGGGIALLDPAGGVVWSWHDTGPSLFANGRYAAELPAGGYVLVGQPHMLGLPLVIFDSFGQYMDLLYGSSDYDSNRPEAFTVSDTGEMLRLVRPFNGGYPVLISTNSSGSTKELLSFSMLGSGESYPISLVSTADNGVAMLLNNWQNNNSDIIVKKIGDVDLLD